MKTRISLMLLAVVSLVGCVERGKDGELPMYTYDKQVEYPLQDIPPYKKVEMIPLETSDTVLLDGFKSMKVAKDFIAVCAGNKLLLFNWDGSFIAQVGSKGQGPGEYLTIGAYYLDEKNKRIGIIDPGTGMMCLTYDYSGKYVASRQLPMEQIGIVEDACLLDDGSLLMGRSCSYIILKSFALTHVDGEVVTDMLPYSPLMPIVNAFRHNISCQGTDIHVLMPFNDTIFSFSKQGVEPSFTIEIPGEMVTIGDNMQDQLSKGRFNGFSDLFESNDHLLLNYDYKGALAAFFLADKHSKEGKYYLNVISPPIERVPFFSRVVQVYKDRFICCVSPHTLFTIRELLMEDSKDESLQQLIKLIDGLKEDDNPVLFMYTF